MLVVRIRLTKWMVVTMMLMAKKLVRKTIDTFSV